MLASLAEFYDEHSADIAQHVIDDGLPRDSPLNLLNWSFAQGRLESELSPRTWAYYFDSHARILAQLQAPGSQIPNGQRKCTHE